MPLLAFAAAARRLLARSRFAETRSAGPPSRALADGSARTPDAGVDEHPPSRPLRRTAAHGRARPRTAAHGRARACTGAAASSACSAPASARAPAVTLRCCCGRCALLLSSRKHSGSTGRVSGPSSGPSGSNWRGTLRASRISSSAERCHEPAVQQKPVYLWHAHHPNASHFALLIGLSLKLDLIPMRQQHGRTRTTRASTAVSAVDDVPLERAAPAPNTRCTRARTTLRSTAQQLLHT